MISNTEKYSYNDLTIVPAEISSIKSRSECKPFYNDYNLPIFTSPMSTIVNEANYNLWEANNINAIVPRNIDIETRWKYAKQERWVAMSLSEFESIFYSHNQNFKNRLFLIGEFEDPALCEGTNFHICVDLANGHMEHLYDVINGAKHQAETSSYNLVVMTGNIANPKTYKWICENADVDYIRLSIGTGNNCLTATQTSIYYPIASLIDECYKIKKWIIDYKRNEDGTYVDNYKCAPKIIADGGIRGYADVIKALGLGADYVMIGSVFTGLLESAAPLLIKRNNSHYNYSFSTDGTVNDGVSNILNIWQNEYSKESVYHEQWEERKRNFIKDMDSIEKESYGMSTKKAQKMINPKAKGNQLKTSEGCTKIIPVNETIHQWTDNMISYLKSAMSYTNAKSLDEFIGKCEFVVNSNCAILAVNK